MDFVNLISSLLVLVILEVVLSIDNLIILSILTEGLPLKQKKTAQRLGLTVAWVARLFLLASAVYLASLVKPLFTIWHFSFSVRDLFLILGGLFLVWKASDEIHQDMLKNQVDNIVKGARTKNTLSKVLVQIVLLDIIFSLDSVLTAVGLTSNFIVMAIAITIAIAIMIWASEPVSAFIKKYPTLKMLALSYLILIGTILIVDGFSYHVPRGYLYFSLGFSLSVEFLNVLKQSRRK